MEVRDAESKRTVLTELLEQGMVLVTLDARRDGVDVPAHLRDDAQLRLNLSYRFGLPMSLDDGGVIATLTFAGSPYPCRLPWGALYLFVSHVSGRPILFPSDVPAEFSLTRLGSARPAASQMAVPTAWAAPRQHGRPRLSIVTSSGTSSGEPSPEAEEGVFTAAAAAGTVSPAEQDQPKTPPRRGHLRVVK